MYNENVQAHDQKCAPSITLFTKRDSRIPRGVFQPSMSHPHHFYREYPFHHCFFVVVVLFCFQVKSTLFRQTFVFAFLPMLLYIVLLYSSLEPCPNSYSQRVPLSNSCSENTLNINAPESLIVKNSPVK